MQASTPQPTAGSKYRFRWRQQLLHTRCKPHCHPGLGIILANIRRQDCPTMGSVSFQYYDWTLLTIIAVSGSPGGGCDKGTNKTSIPELEPVTFGVYDGQSPNSASRQ